MTSPEAKIDPITATIDKRIGEVRTDVLDLSFGEIINLHAEKELVISPEYQRLFRWTEEQQSRLIESIILELPIPQIFLIENENGVMELIDGLQRVNSVIHFIEPKVIELSPLKLKGCDIIPELNDKEFKDLPLNLRLRIKRSSVRSIVIKRQSKSLLKYEMFKRLNTGGAILAPQEIRNCTARMVGEDGVKFYQLLQDLARTDDFKTCTETLAQAEKDQKADEELVLRFFACKNAIANFRGSVRDWLDDYMESIVLRKTPFDYKSQEDDFKKVFERINEVMGENAFVKHRTSKPMGGLAPAYFEAVSIGMERAHKKITKIDRGILKKAIIGVIQSADFKTCTGPAANTKRKLEDRISLIEKALVQCAK